MSNFATRGVRPNRPHGTLCGCGREKKSFQRFCTVCWPLIPAELREKILDRKMEFRIEEFRALLREARRLINEAMSTVVLK